MPKNQTKKYFMKETRRLHLEKFEKVQPPIAQPKQQAFIIAQQSIKSS